MMHEPSSTTAKGRELSARELVPPDGGGEGEGGGGKAGAGGKGGGEGSYR
jgi:hypothetical protein